MHKSSNFLWHTLLFLLVFVTAAPLAAEELQVFVSSFAPGDEGAIHAYELDTDSGSIRQTAKNKGVAQPFFLALSPNRKNLYSIHAPAGFGGEENEQIAAYRISGDDGELELLNHQSSLGTASCYLDVDASGKTLVVANYSTGSVVSYPINRDGSIQEAQSFIQHKGSSVNESRQQAPHAHCIVVSPDNRFIYAADLGIDKIVAYRLGKKSTLVELGDAAYPRLAPGAGPRHLTFHPNRRHLYVINELLNTVTVFDYANKSGLLSETQTIATLPADFDGTSYTADIKVTPNGRFAYGTNRGHDSLACYRVGNDGRLATIDIIPSLGKGPQNLAITPDGRILICANMPGNNVAIFHIDAESGRLTSVAEPITITGPSCIMIR